MSAPTNEPDDATDDPRAVEDGADALAVGRHRRDETPACYALLGNPNTGKTTLFNRLSGIRAKTANFPGSTVEARVGSVALGSHSCRVVDLPGLYGLNLDRPESRTCRDYLAGTIDLGEAPEAIVVVVDASNLARNLVFVNQALQQGLPAVIALNMIDVARRRRIDIDLDGLRRRLGCPVVPVCGRSGEGVDALLTAMRRPVPGDAPLSDPNDAQAARRWAEAVTTECVDDAHAHVAHRFDDRLDALFTHPVLGLVVFVAVMAGLFYTIFTLATVPMALIELVFAHLGSFVGSLIPPGAIHDLLVDGVVSGVAGTVVFLPQICLLFFLISILEDTGYLARAVFVVDRIMHRFGLPGQSFVPLLAAHACAIPAIMSARLIPDQRDRIATVLVTPFMSCSARLPVYVLLVGILFDDALRGGLAFAACYVLGAGAALLTALLARHTVVRGASSPMMIELPPYRLPSLRTALVTTLDRALLFLRKAGTVIVAICIILWWLSAYPRTDEPGEATALRAQAAEIASTDASASAALLRAADTLAARHAMANSMAGRLGRAAEPVFEPLGLDWQLTIGVVTSFAAREVFVSTLAVIFAGTDDGESDAVLYRIRKATRDDGTDLFTVPVAASLLVFYVLAMQCLPTLPVTARETGHWGWAALQFGYMSGVAWIAAFATYHGLVGLAGFGGAG